MRERHRPEALFLEHLQDIECISAALCRRKGLGEHDAEDFLSWVKLKLLENDYAVLRKFRGESALTTYLTVVVAMLMRDYRVQRWGRWRPSAAARRAGEVAVRLETLVYRDGRRLEEAGEMLRTEGCTELSDVELARLLDSLPQRAPLRPVDVGPAPLQGATASAQADDRVLDEERADERQALEADLARALQSLDAEDRLVLRLRFWEGLTVADVARVLDLRQKPLYRRIERLTRALRRRLEAAGVSADRVATYLGEGER